MKLLLPVYSDEYNESRADYALLDLAEEVARSFLLRRNLAQQAKAIDENFCSLEFWSGHVDWVGGLFLDVPADAPELYDVLHGALDKVVPGWEEAIYSGSGFELPENFALPDYYSQRTECDRIIVDTHGIRFTSYPKHTDRLQETAEVPFDLIEVAAGYREAEQVVHG